MPLDLDGSEFHSSQNKSQNHSQPDTMNSTNSNEYRMDPVYSSNSTPKVHKGDSKGIIGAKPIIRPSMQTIPENPCETRTRVVNGSEEKSMDEQTAKLLDSGIGALLEEKEEKNEDTENNEMCSELFPCKEEEGTQSKPDRSRHQTSGNQVKNAQTENIKTEKSFKSLGSKKTLKSKINKTTPNQTNNMNEENQEVNQSDAIKSQRQETNRSSQRIPTERSNVEEMANKMSSKFNQSSHSTHQHQIMTNHSEISSPTVPSPKSPQFQNSFSNRSQNTPRVLSSSHKSKSRSKIVVKTHQNEEKPRKAPKPRITSGNRIRPGERLPSAKSKASPTETSKHRKNLNIPNYVRTDPQEIALLNIFSECESKLDRGAINIFCSKSDWLECSFMLSDENPAINIQSFHLLGGALQQVTIPLTPESPMLCRIFFEVLKPTDKDVSVLLFSCGRWIAIRLAQYVRNCRSNTDPEAYCDLALCNLSTGTIMPTIAMLPFRPQVSTGLPEIRRLVSFIQNSKFGAAQFFGFDQEHVEQKDQEYLLSAEEAKTSINSYEISGDLSFLLGSLRRDKKKNISLTLLQRAVPLWQQIAKETADFDFEQSFEEDEDFDQMDSFSDVEAEDAFVQDFN